MPFISEVNDITKIKVDAIANSFGLKGRQFGRICESIYKSLNDPIVEKQFVEADYNVGEVFITSAGSLPCKNIINIVTPFANKDTEDLVLLTKAYREIINKAIELGCKSLAVPMMGTGANGYEKSQSYTAFTNAVGELLALEENKKRNILEIHFLIYFSKEIRYDARDINKRKFRNSEYYRDRGRQFDDLENDELIVKDYTKTIDEEQQQEYQRKLLFLMKPNYQEYIPDCSYDSAYYFVEDMINKKNLDPLILNKWNMDRRLKGNFKSGKRAMSRYQIFMSTIILDLNITEALQILSLSNFGFNINDPIDRFIMDYLCGELPHFKNKYEFDQFFNKYDYLSSIKIYIEFQKY